MKNRAALILSVMAMAAAQVASAQNFNRLGANLTGFEETPSTLSTTGNGRFDALISGDETEIVYRLSYSDLEGAVTQAHIHLGQRATTGGISVWLCGNPSATTTPPITPPAGTPLCPPSPGTVEGTITAANVVGPTGQGIAPGEFEELLRAIRAGATYANVHSTTRPGGEIRNQISAGSSQSR